MYRKAANNQTTGQQNPLPYTPIEDADISKSTNRFTSGTTYDEAGNVVNDAKFRSMTFAYDANGRMAKSEGMARGEALSVYDAAGVRVAEKVNDIWRNLVYDIGGKLVAEYGGAEQTGVGGVNYVMQDWQGSTRAVVNAHGFVRSRNDYTAFGEDVGSGTGLRTENQGFGLNTSVRQKYGLTERDDATGLDHTWFRKHETQAGRWTSPDPYNGSMNIGDPQSFNRYSYVQNDPTNYIDPSGLQIIAFSFPTNCRYNPYWEDESEMYVCDVGWHFMNITSTGGFIDAGGGVELPPLIQGAETFNECISGEVKKHVSRFKEDLTEALGEAVITAGLTAISVILVAAILEPTPIGEITVGFVAAAVTAAAATAALAYIFNDARLRKQLRRNIEDALDNCKDKDGAPAFLPSIDSVLKRVQG